MPKHKATTCMYVHAQVVNKINMNCTDDITEIRVYALFQKVPTMHGELSLTAISSYIHCLLSWACIFFIILSFAVNFGWEITWQKQVIMWLQMDLNCTHTCSNNKIKQCHTCTFSWDLAAAAVLLTNRNINANTDIMLITYWREYMEAS